MKRFYIDSKLKVNENVELGGIEHNHLKNVVRCKEGDNVILVCGDNFDYVCQIVNIFKNSTTLKVIEQLQNNCNPHVTVDVFQALTKSDNMSLIAQKLTELGVTHLIPFESHYITAKDKYNTTTKLQSVSNQSIKQCRRSIPLQVMPTISFKELVNKIGEYDKVIFANECEQSLCLDKVKLLHTDKIALIIGSEGGFDEQEIELLKSKNAISITLGNRIMRAETASMAITSVVMFLLGEWQK